MRSIFPKKGKEIALLFFILSVFLVFNQIQRIKEEPLPETTIPQIQENLNLWIESIF